MFLSGTKRVEHFAAMVLIGDGMMAIVQPSKDASAWKRGPRFWRVMMRGLAKRPGLTRAIGAAQVVGAVIWALNQEKD